MDGSVQAALEGVQIHRMRELSGHWDLVRDWQIEAEQERGTTTERWAEVFGSAFDLRNASRAGTSVANCGLAEL